METSSLLNQAFDTAMGTLFLTGTDGVALYANAALEKQTGFSVGEIVGKTPGKLWGGQMPRLFYDQLWAAIGGKREPFVSMIDNRRKDRASYSNLLAIAPIRNESGDPEYFLSLQTTQAIGKSERERFGREFQNLFSPGKQYMEAELLRWIAKTLDTRYDVPLGVSGTLLNTFKKALVSPFEKRFRARAEDRELITAAQEDQAAFQMLYDKYRHQIFLYFVRHIGGDAEVAEDLMHDTFYRALRYLKTFQVTNASYGTYLLRVAHNVLVNHYRKKEPVAFSDALLENEAAPETAEVSLSESLFLAAELQETERRVLAMKYREGFSVHEIATTLNKSENAIKLHLSRARKKLRRLMW